MMSWGVCPDSGALRIGPTPNLEPNKPRPALHGLDAKVEVPQQLSTLAKRQSELRGGLLSSLTAASRSPPGQVRVLTLSPSSSQLVRLQPESVHTVWLSLSSFLLLALVLLCDHVPADKLLPHVLTTPANPSMSSLQTYLTQAKADFLAELEQGKPLTNWVIATGNEAGGELPPLQPHRASLALRQRC